MPNYYVMWEIDINASTPLEAAREALAIQRDSQSIATVFEVIDEDGKTHHIDLTEKEQDRG